ncbi:MAG: glycosyltransferase [Bryobacteraceae bacterium]|nr:glycosyltransferase [Bryobacteraceae bacterium]
MSAAIRLALFADSFHEVNGVALTCRQFESHAARNGLPLLGVHSGPATRAWDEGSVTHCELTTSKLFLPLDSGLRFDLAFWRHSRFVEDALRAFRPDAIHITGPSHIGILGLLLSRRLRLPLFASWHTNVHEYAGRRLPPFLRAPLGRAAERASLALTARFYRFARALFAPNMDLVRLLEARTGRECHLMTRGVDTQLFRPGQARSAGAPLSIGYVGRLSVEKNVRLLASVEKSLSKAGLDQFAIDIAGSGSERGWLRANVARLRDHGTLHGEALARLYSQFDIFVFPSETDTFGNVVQEAMASGVACVVMDKGGPASIVRHGETGLVASSPESFCRAAVELASAPWLRRRLGRAARTAMHGRSWDSVFEEMYRVYGQDLLASPPLPYASSLELENRAV